MSDWDSGSSVEKSVSLEADSRKFKSNDNVECTYIACRVSEGAAGNP